MSLYVALLTGVGEGCDYTIGCNKQFYLCECLNDEAAVRWCKENVREVGSYRVEEVTLFKIAEEVELPESILDANLDDQIKELEDELEDAEERVDRLRSKLEAAVKQRKGKK
jgi:chaperonin cofactor prefoldin